MNTTLFTIIRYSITGLFENVTLTTAHHNRATTELKDMQLVRRIQGFDV